MRTASARSKVSVAHGEWLPWIEANLSFGTRQVQKYLRLARNAEELPNATSNSHLTIDGALTALSSSQTLRVMGSSASDEWYTPPHIFDLATAVLGEVDLDPSWHPDSPVQASTTYTEADDGLVWPWHGKTWMNPPYGREIGDWTGKLVDEYEAGG
jgi:DNA N-6-adenine-methyltransferase (Dam)